MGQEIERKYLIHRDYWQCLKKSAGQVYRQGYLLMDADKTIRVRVTETSGFLTIKGRTTGISRPEYEYEIPYTEANELLDKFKMAEVLKIRYKIIHNGKLWEVDEFLGENEGLILAEIELEKEDEEFAIPEWVAGEVTDDIRYLNSNLAINPYQNWHHEH